MEAGEEVAAEVEGAHGLAEVQEALAADLGEDVVREVELLERGQRGELVRDQLRQLIAAQDQLLQLHRRPEQLIYCISL